MTQSDPLPLLREALAERYDVERVLGEGGMATVYVARDLRHHRQVAIKVLKPDLVAVLGAQRFLNEIQVTANLQHPHILELYDSGTANGARAEFSATTRMGRRCRGHSRGGRRVPAGEARYAERR